MNLELKVAILKHFQQQKNFAEVVGVSEPVLSHVITGRRRLPEGQQKVWARLLKTDRRKLFEPEGG